MANPINYESTGPADQKIFDDFRRRVGLSADLLQRVKVMFLPVYRFEYIFFHFLRQKALKLN